MSDLIPRGRVDAATRSEALAVLHAYADGDLLSRVEAAVDPEVIEAVMRGAIYWPATQWTWLSMRPSQDDVSGITWEVTDDE